MKARLVQQPPPSHSQVDASLAGAFATDKTKNQAALPASSQQPTYKNGRHQPYASSTAWNSITIVLCATYLILQTVMPFYNKIALDIYAYPITACLLQVSGVVLLLLLAIGVMQCLHNRRSLHFCHVQHLLFKCKHLLLPALFFSLNMILTNIGIHLTSVNRDLMVCATHSDLHRR